MIITSGMDRLPTKENFEKYYTNFGGKLSWEEVVRINRNLSFNLAKWRHSYEAHRDARLVYAQARIGRPMELRRRLYLGKFAGGLDLPGPDGFTPLEIAFLRGNTACVAVIDEVIREYNGLKET